jgi:hypothetical protein
VCHKLINAGQHLLQYESRFSKWFGILRNVATQLFTTAGAAELFQYTVSHFSHIIPTFCYSCFIQAVTMYWLSYAEAHNSDHKVSCNNAMALGFSGEMAEELHPWKSQQIVMRSHNRQIFTPINLLQKSLVLGLGCPNFTDFPYPKFEFERKIAVE